MAKICASCIQNVLKMKIAPKAKFVFGRCEYPKCGSNGIVIAVPDKVLSKFPKQ